VRRLIRVPTGSSFPSGHAAVGMATMALLAERARGPRSRSLLYGAGAYVPRAASTSACTTRPT
jgi:membrane-associated phospholipid phosphatase